MQIEKIERNGISCAVVQNDVPVITDADSALDVLMAAKYAAGTKNIAVSKSLVREDFFVLSTGIAGAVLQKIIDYQGRIAIYGDFSRYTSKPLKDFIYESNKGRDVFFAASKDEAVAMLTKPE